MSLFCDKYAPKRFDSLQFNQIIAIRLKRLISNENFPHILIHGPRGSGRHTLINCMLYELFGSASSKTRIEEKECETPSGKKIIQQFVSSNFHLEVNPSENGFYDRIVVQELIKEVATSRSLTKKFNFKIIVIDDADLLSKEAQQSLRRTLEKYVATCRVFLIAEQSTRIIPALRSRCVAIRCSSPSHDQMKSILKDTCNAENIKVPTKTLDSICKQSDGNIRMALMSLQANQKDDLNEISDSELFVWRSKILEIAKKMIRQQSSKTILEIRAILYDLEVHLIPVNLILRYLVMELLNHCLDNEMRINLIETAAEVDRRITIGSKSIIHMELFCVKFMMIYRCTVEKIALDLVNPMELD